MATVARMRTDSTAGGPGRGAGRGSWPSTRGAPRGGAPRPAVVVLAVAGGLLTLAASLVAVQQSGPGPSLATSVGSQAASAGSLSGQPVPTLGQWVGEADAVCRSGLEGYAALPRPGTPAQEVTYIRSVHAVARRIDIALGQIEAPTADRSLVAGMVNDLETETVWIDDLANAMASGNRSGQVTAVHGVNSAAAAAAQLARQLGAADCATMAGG